MKKSVAILVLSIMLLSVFAVGVSAQSMNNLGGTPDGTTATVKRADPANVVKDGVIGKGEYEKLPIDTDGNSTFLHLVFGTAANLDEAEAMLPTMEYYASWCDGMINIAVRNKPTVIQQILDVKTDGEYPEDWFCRNIAYTISSDRQQARGEKNKQCNYYFAVAKKTDTGEYLVGYYSSNQWGNSEAYKPKANEDFVIAYDYDTGYVTLEWSIPFSEICEGGAASAGDSVYLSIGAEAGAAPDISDMDWYAISLGDFTYGVEGRGAVNHAAFLLSDEAVKSGSEDDGGGNGGNNGGKGGGSSEGGGGGGAENGGNNAGGGGTTEGGNTSGGGSTGGNTNSGNGGAAPRTGDPMIVTAAVAALSAAGAFIVGKKRR